MERERHWQKNTGKVRNLLIKKKSNHHPKLQSHFPDFFLIKNTFDGKQQQAQCRKGQKNKKLYNLQHSVTAPAVAKAAYDDHSTRVGISLTHSRAGRFLECRCF